MPTVASLLDSVKSLALVGSGNADDTARIMRYMNMVYAEAYRVTSSQYPTLLLTSENISMTSGVGTIAAAPFTVMRVKNTSTNRILEARSKLDVEELFPTMTDTGEPAYYYMEGTTGLRSYPLDNATLQVRYIPSVNTLASTGVEADIKIPPEFHEMLLWGTLVYMAYDERDKSAAGEISIAQSKYEIALNDFKTWLAKQQTRTPMVTKVVFGGV